MAKNLKAMFIIVDRGKAEKVVRAIEPFMNCGHAMLGRGTAGSELLSLLAVDETEKAIVVFTLCGDDTPKVYELLREKFAFDRPGAGIAFTAPLAAAGGAASLAAISGQFEEK